MPSTPTATPLHPRRPGSRRSRAYRLTRRAILAALFGVIATYAVAWAAVLIATTRLPSLREPLGYPNAKWVYVDKTQWWGFTHYAMLVDYNYGKARPQITGDSPAEVFQSCIPYGDNDPRWSNPQAFTESARNARAVLGRPRLAIVGPSGRIGLMDAGFPLKAVTCWTYLDGPSSRSSFLGHFGALNLSSKWLPSFAAQFGDTLLPYTPIWPNFLACVALYGFGPWLLFESFAALRRHRGLCPHCRYDLRGLPPTAPCPECGLTR